MNMKDRSQLTAVAYATKSVSILKYFHSADPSIKQQALIYAASNGSLDALEYIVTDEHYSTIDINAIDPIHGETGKFIVEENKSLMGRISISSINECS